MRRLLPSVRAVAMIVVLGLATSGLRAAEPSAPMVRVSPRESDDLLANPGMGWQTFHRFADEDPTLAGLPSASAYFRFYWREIEPEDGRIDFARFDDLLAHAHRAGQKLAFRIMCTGSGEYLDVPAWIKEQGCRGVDFNYGGRRHWVPDFSDPTFQRAHLRLIRQLGAHYDGHPDLDLVDIGSVGLWGEWHMSDTEAVGTGQPVPLPPEQVRLAVVDAWCTAFPRTPKVVQIGSEEGMARADKVGYGWRADCLGDLGGFSKTWNHMDNFYPQQIEKTGAQDAWKLAPIAWETCWDMRKWVAEGWNVRTIFDYALRCHASYLNNKSAPIPDGTRDEIEWLLRRLGYRLVIRSLEHAATMRAGVASGVVVSWENLGVAPPYRDYRVAFAIGPGEGTTSRPIVCVTDTSIRGWLPGKRETRLVLKVPGPVAPGRYPLAIGIIDPNTEEPAVRLAITGRSHGGWYPVSELTVVR